MLAGVFQFTLSRSVNEVICHGIPDQRKLEDGDIVNLGGSHLNRASLILIDKVDVTAYYDGDFTQGFEDTALNGECLGYHGDLNETYPVGNVDADSTRLMRTARECLDAAIALCKPGALFRDLGRTM
jgi:methionyl aminopeptidase